MVELAFVAKSRVEASSVVEALDVIEDCGGGVATKGRSYAVDQLVFERAPERFHSGVIVAVTPAAHGGDATVAGQGGTIGCTAILQLRSE